MNWNKFFTATPDCGHRGSENETETEDDEDITDSNGTVSTERKQNFLGMRINKFSENDFSYRCMKFVFVIINGATFLAGIIGVATSIWNLTDGRIMSRLIGQRGFSTTFLFMSIIASLSSLLGILGILRGRRKFLNIYILLYLLFLGIMFITAIMSFRIFEEITRRIQNDMNAAIESYHSSFSSREAWDNTHRYLKCCGLKSAKDWARYLIDIPKSCCSKTIGECLHMSESVAYKSGCLKNTVLLLKSYVHAVTVSALLIFSTIVSQSIRMSTQNGSKYMGITQSMILLLSFLLALCVLIRMKR